MVIYVCPFSDPVGFLAYLSASTTDNGYTGNKLLRFDKIRYNDGLYDPITGHCTIPSPGRYLITIVVWGNSRHATFDLMIDGKRNVHTHANDGNDGDHVTTGTMNIVLHLEKGQKLAVYPRILNDQQIGGSDQLLTRFGVNKLSN